MWSWPVRSVFREAGTCCFSGWPLEAEGLLLHEPEASILNYGSPFSLPRGLQE